MYPPAAFGDAITSNTALSGIMAALFHRTRTGKGMRLTTSLLASGIWCNFNHIIGGQERSDDRVPPVLPRRWTDTTSAMSNIYQCKDGRWMLLATVWNKLHACMKAIGLGEYVTDPRFATREAAAENSVALRDLMAEAFKAKTAAEWDPILTEADSVHQEMYTSADICKLQQAWDNDYLTNVKFPNGEEYVLPNSPVTFFDYEHAHSQPVGGIGCDTTALLSGVGYTAEQIADLKARGIAAGK
jgi:formyl-CoA transferase